MAGSGGGLNEPRAALYASHGYAALALGYFKAPGLSDYISNTRLEIFETALRWMHRTHDANAISRAVENARAGGIANISLDLIFALPDAVERSRTQPDGIVSSIAHLPEWIEEHL